MAGVYEKLEMFRTCGKVNRDQHEYGYRTPQVTIINANCIP